MSKSFNNLPCPCLSGMKYKKCCGKYHKGALAPNALTLMKSRYSAYATNNANYIIKTTHKDNIDYNIDTKLWKTSIELFCKNTKFLQLTIISFSTKEDSAYVEFEAKLGNETMMENSYFVKENSMWLYHSGVVEM